MNHTTDPARFLIFGDGFIATEVAAVLASQGETFSLTKVRLQDRIGIQEILNRLRPTHVINAAGQRGDKNADWCESHRLETIQTNLLGALTLADTCLELGIHLTQFGSGCIYQFDDDHPIGGEGYTEDDPPNFSGTFYGYSKTLSESALKHYPNTLILRIRFPIAASSHEKNHVIKIMNYKRLTNVPNSASILPNLLPGAILLAKHKDTGIFNFTNPGLVSNGTIMQCFKHRVNPSLEWSVYSDEEFVTAPLTPRSNCALDSSKLVSQLMKYDYKILDVEEAMSQAFDQMRERIDFQGRDKS